MRKRTKLGLAIISAVAVTACTEQSVTSPSAEPNERSAFSLSSQAITPCGTPMTVTLLADRTIDAGTITVANDADNLYVTYATTGGWTMMATHLSATQTAAQIPTNKPGNPKPGHFGHKATHNSGTSSHTYTIPLASLDREPGDPVIVAAQAELRRSGKKEDAWGNGTRISRKGNWGMYFEYTVQACAVAMGTVTGQVLDAMDGQPIAGAEVTFTPAQGAAASTSVAAAAPFAAAIAVSAQAIYTATTGPDGVYSIEVPVGPYVMTVFYNSYIVSEQTLEVLENQTTELPPVGLSPVVPDGQTRIVLTWGATPSDLDSHLTGPIPGSTNRFHVYYGEQGDLHSSPFAFLDRDDVTSFGPETITITDAFAGTYRYSVHDYSNRGASSSSAMGGSGAVVRVYRGSAQVAEYSVPRAPGTLWTVFTMNGGTGALTEVNSMTFESSPSAILSVPDIAVTGATVTLQSSSSFAQSVTDAAVIRAAVQNRRK